MNNPTAQYQHLGGRTWLWLLFKRSPLAILSFIILILAFVFSSFVPTTYNFYSDIAFLILLAIFILADLLALLLSWLEYSHYKILLDEESIKVSRGLISEEEVGVPLKRIKEANIERSLFEQMFGVGRLVLTILGEDDKEDSLVLPAIKKDLAMSIQNIVLKRAEVEEFDMEDKKTENKIDTK